MNTAETGRISIKKVALEDAAKASIDDPRKAISLEQVQGWVHFLNNGWFRRWDRGPCVMDLVTIFPSTFGSVRIDESDVTSLIGARDSWINYVQERFAKQLFKFDNKTPKKLTGGLIRDLRSRFWAVEGENDFSDFAAARLVYADLDLSSIEDEALVEISKTVAYFPGTTSEDMASTALANFRLAFPNLFPNVSIPDAFFESLEAHGENLAKLNRSVSYISHLRDMCILRASGITYKDGVFEFDFGDKKPEVDLQLPQVRRF